MKNVSWSPRGKGRANGTTNRSRTIMVCGSFMVCGVPPQRAAPAFKPTFQQFAETFPDCCARRFGIVITIAIAKERKTREFAREQRPLWLYGPQDFIIRHEIDRGLPNVISLIGIESPGITASPAIGEHVQGMVRGLLFGPTFPPLPPARSTVDLHPLGRLFGTAPPPPGDHLTGCGFQSSISTNNMSPTVGPFLVFPGPPVTPVPARSHGGQSYDGHDVPFHLAGE